jgi:hypothetical protein
LVCGRHPLTCLVCPSVKSIVAERFFGSSGTKSKEPVGIKRYEMDVKYHGILLGKKGVTVKALEKASGATIRFETTPKGALVIMGTEKQRDIAWKLITSVQSTLPKILSQIRDKEIRSLCPPPSPAPRGPTVLPPETTATASSPCAPCRHASHGTLLALPQIRALR